MKGQKIKIPYRINRDPGLSYTARRVYCALRYFHLLASRRGGRLLKTYSEIAVAAGIKDGKTIAKAVQELEAAGYIDIKEHGYWDADQQLVRRGTNEYILLPINDIEKDYVWVPVKLLSAPISPAAFAVLLFLLRKQGCNNRAWPSLRRGFQQIVQKNGKPMPRKTICAALEQLKNCLMLIVYHCLKVNRAFSMNSYMLTVWGDWTPEQAMANVDSLDDNDRPSTTVSVEKGGYFFGDLPVRTKITNGFYLEGKGLGVCEFGNLNKTRTDLPGFSPSDVPGLCTLMSILEEQFWAISHPDERRTAPHPQP
ncbi:MAG: hypothetical protein J6J18_06610 [Oscillospiraceae bacterium]|nr:hypothetical protein [Oscillospiraceae bacterium]